jgi:2-aminoadipate transaminase
MLECIDKYFDKRVTHTRPGGGIFIWCDLPEGYSGTDLWRFALEHKVACVPGSTFDVKLDPKNRGFRLNFSLPSFEEIEKGCRIMGECIREFLK